MQKPARVHWFTRSLSLQLGLSAAGVLLRLLQLVRGLPVFLGQDGFLERVDQEGSVIP